MRVVSQTLNRTNPKLKFGTAHPRLLVPWEHKRILPVRLSGWSAPARACGQFERNAPNWGSCSDARRLAAEGCSWITSKATLIDHFTTDYFISSLLINGCNKSWPFYFSGIFQVGWMLIQTSISQLSHNFHYPVFPLLFSNGILKAW